MNALNLHLFCVIVVLLYEVSSGIWQHLLSRVDAWRSLFGDLFVVTGPVFDADGDGLADVTIPDAALPSHYFVVLLRCNNSADVTACHDDVDYLTQTFVVPHTRNVSNCMVSRVCVWVVEWP